MAWFADATYVKARQGWLDLLHLIKQFSQGQSCLPELHRAHVAQRRMDPLLVVPPHIRVELAAELVEAGERLPVDELPLQDLVGGLVDLLHLIKQFSQGQSCLPELHRAHVAQRRMDPLLVVPPHIRVELAAELVEAGERALYLRGAVLAAVPLVDPDDVGCYGVVGGLGLGVRQHPVVRGPGHAEHAAHG